jgi:Glycosyltransferase family 10 (fucosyltransferase) C-term
MSADARSNRGPATTFRIVGGLAGIIFAVAALVRCAFLYEEFRVHDAATATWSAHWRRSRNAHTATTTDEEAALPHRGTPPKPKRSPRHVYTCGYGNLFGAMGEPFANLATALFPDANTSHWDENSRGAPPSLDELGPDDVLIWPCGGTCPFLPTPEMAIKFPGPILTVNGESSPDKCDLGPSRDNVYPLDRIGTGTGDPFVVDSSAQQRTRRVATYFAALDVASMPRELRQIVFDPIQRAQHANTGERFLIYAASNCRSYREQAFRALSAIGDVYYGGLCSGWIVPPYQTVGLPDRDAVRSSWQDNVRHFHRYRFALVMENDDADGYVTEKIINAFLAGTIPVYYGTRDIFELFNPRAFVFYDIANPQPAIDLVAHLEANQTAYLSMLHEPIVAHGDETIARYFSLHEDDPGAGRLKWAIRELIGYGYS